LCFREPDGLFEKHQRLLRHASVLRLGDIFQFAVNCGRQILDYNVWHSRYLA
jgi:hypothetical protein